ncbi:hypothetical protein QZH41_015487, partial [Actinostola sp. cb2023]
MNEISTQTFGIDKIVIHDRFLTDKGIAYDIALIKLSRPAVLTFAVGLASLPRQGDRVPVGTKCHLKGYDTIVDGGFVPQGLLFFEITLSGNTFEASLPRAYKSKLKEWPQILEGDGAGVQSLSDYLVSCREAMKTMDCLLELNSTETLIQISAKLPSYVGTKWCRHAHKLKQKTKKSILFSDLVEFVKTEANLATDPAFSPDILKRERNKEKSQDKESKGQQYNRRVPYASTHYTSTSSTREDEGVNVSQCPSCSKNHSLDDCQEFKDNSIEDRVKFVRNKSLCFGCYGNDHHSRNCTSRLTCKECGKRHPTALHRDSKNVEEPKREANAKEDNERVVHVSNCANTCNSASLENHVINSMIVPVWLHHKDNPQHEVLVYALLDDASDTTFVRTSTLEALGVSGTEIKLNLYTMHGKAEIPVQRVDGLVVKGFDKAVNVPLPKTYSRDYIPSMRNQIPRRETANLWPHFKKIADKLPPYQSNIDVGLLIGCNCPKAIKPREVILGESDDPYAIRTLLGWGILGPVTQVKELSDESDAETYGVCHHAVSQEVGSPDRTKTCFVVPTQTKEVVNPFQVKRMFDQDFSEANTNKSVALSQDDRKFLAKVKEGIRHDIDGHYEMPLPLRDPSVKLPNNRDVVLRRLLQLKRKLIKADSQYRDHYVAFMDKVIKSGYAEKVPQVKSDSTHKPDGNHVWYIPHHGVYHPKKPGKIRVVFDCSAEYNGESLNKHPLQGPDLTNNLTGVLCRFRKEPVAIMCDIEAMFYQVKVTENGDTSTEPQEYRMTVHLFGAASSPGCSNFALKTTADDNEEYIGSTPAEFLRKDFYVDDGLKSVPSVDEAIELINGIKEMCKLGGFNLHKFTSNKKEVIEQIPVEDEAEAIVNSRPLTVDALSDPDAPSSLTPNHLLTMKTKVVLPPPGNFQSEDVYSRKRWRHVQHLTNEFWHRWKKEYLLTLQRRQKWSRHRKDLAINDVVIIKDDNSTRNKWELAHVVKTNQDQDGRVRTVELVLADPFLSSQGKRVKPARTLERPVQKLVLLTSQATEEYL